MTDDFKTALRTINKLQKENERLQKVVDAAVEWRAGPFEVVFPVPPNIATAKLRDEIAEYESDSA